MVNDMGGPNSGRPSDGTGARNQPKAALAVVGSGVPEPLSDLTVEQRRVWDWIVETTSGVAFNQDSMAVEELAKLYVRQQKNHRRLDADPSDDDASKLALAIGRRMEALWHCFGLDPRSRQGMLKPSNEVAELDELEQMMQDRD